MTNRERENATLAFLKPDDRGAVEETFFPWNLTVERFAKEELPAETAGNILDIVNDDSELAGIEKYLNVSWGKGIFNYEKYLGLDPVRRVGFTLPFRRFDEKVLEETGEYVIKSNGVGRQLRINKLSGLVEEHRQVVTCAEDWEELKEHGNRELERYYSDENIKKVYGALKEGHKKGDYSIRLNIEGFFWTPRELLGIEPHLYAFYDEPELIHDMNEYILGVYLDKLVKVLDILPADVLYIMEDLSGKNGPMI